MSHEFIASEPTYWVAHEKDGADYGYAETGQHVATGLDKLETFSRYLPYRARLLELGIDPDGGKQ